jgi:hypothetical protein
MKTTLLSAVAFCASQLVALAIAPVDLGSHAGPTPYDRYMSPVRNVLGSLDGSSPSIEHVRELVRKGRSFRYSFTNPYVASSPAATAARRAGDCKDKALWLADQLNDPSVRFVIGKARATSRISHAWLYWKDSSNRWWILDCTNLRNPIPAERVASNQYIPLFSYARNGSFRHSATQTYMADAVAGRTKAARVAASLP